MRPPPHCHASAPSPRRAGQRHQAGHKGPGHTQEGGLGSGRAWSAKTAEEAQRVGRGCPAGGPCRGGSRKDEDGLPS